MGAMRLDEPVSRQLLARFREGHAHQDATHPERVKPNGTGDA